MKSQGMPSPGGATRPSSIRKQTAIVDAAARAFLRDGFTGATMDDIATSSDVSKQTLYSHFGNKEALFLAVIESQATAAGNRVFSVLAGRDEATDVRSRLEEYARALLETVLVPELLALRRLVIGEATRFPQLARRFWETGPARSLEQLADLFEGLARDGQLSLDDPKTAAATFNWLVIAGPLNQTMMLGDSVLPDPSQRHEISVEATRVFLAAHGRPDAVD